MKCPQCKADVQRVDAFCGNCGAAILPASGKSPHEAGRCTACGQVNDSTAVYCESCGTPIPGRTEKSETTGSRQPRRKTGTASSAGKTLGFLQSWKLTLGLAAVFVVVLVVIDTSRDERTHQHDATQGDFSAHAAQMKAEIEQLQNRVDANPGDTEAMLSLANRLHDVRSFSRAVAMYEHYLQSKPADTDARVDMGICYFELAMADESVRSDYFQKARDEMKKALRYDPNHQLAHFNLGIVFLQSGDPQEANVWFKKCAELDPNSETGKRARELYSQHQSLNIP